MNIQSIVVDIVHVGNSILIGDSSHVGEVTASSWLELIYDSLPFGKAIELAAGEVVEDVTLPAEFFGLMSPYIQIVDDTLATTYKPID